MNGIQIKTCWVAAAMLLTVPAAFAGSPKPQPEVPSPNELPFRELSDDEQDVLGEVISSNQFQPNGDPRTDEWMISAIDFEAALGLARGREQIGAFHTPDVNQFGRVADDWMVINERYIAASNHRFQPVMGASLVHLFRHTLDDHVDAQDDHALRLEDYRARLRLWDKLSLDDQERLTDNLIDLAENMNNIERQAADRERDFLDGVVTDILDAVVTEIEQQMPFVAPIPECNPFIGGWPCDVEQDMQQLNEGVASFIRALDLDRENTGTLNDASVVTYSSDLDERDSAFYRLLPNGVRYAADPNGRLRVATGVDGVDGGDFSGEDPIFQPFNPRNTLDLVIRYLIRDDETYIELLDIFDSDRPRLPPDGFDEVEFLDALEEIEWAGVTDDGLFVMSDFDATLGHSIHNIVTTEDSLWAFGDYVDEGPDQTAKVAWSEVSLNGGDFQEVFTEIPGKPFNGCVGADGSRFLLTARDVNGDGKDERAVVGIAPGRRVRYTVLHSDVGPLVTACRVDEDGVELLYDPAAVERHSPSALAFPVSHVSETVFLRGDFDEDGELTVTDGISILNFLFRGESGPRCLKRGDVDGDDVVSLTDAVKVFQFLFVGGPSLAAPSSAEGPDPDWFNQTVSCPATLTDITLTESD